MRRGFTLVELLVVITILAMLMVIGGVGFQKWMGQGRRADTITRIKSLKGYLEQYRTQRGDYPASRLAAYGIKSHNGINEGVEALVVALTHKEWDGVTIDNESWLANSDGDQAEPNVTRHANPDLFEVVDFWGNPIVYQRYDDYGAEQEYEFVVQASGEIESVAVKGAISELTGSPHDHASFQLRSAGEDGVFGNEDDITSFE